MRHCNINSLIGYVDLGDMFSFVFEGNCVLCSTMGSNSRQTHTLFNMQPYHDILWPVIKSYKISLTLNSVIQGSFKKFLLLFCQAKMIFVIIWLFDHFMLQPVPSVNGVWMITFVNHLHVWVTKFKPSLMFFQLLILTPNNAI